MREPDPQLLRSAQAGDLAAFETLVRDFQADVWRLCFHLLGDREMASDAAQDAFVRAYRFLSRYRGESRFTTWMFAIARNCCLDELRRKARRKNVADAVAGQVEQVTRDPSLRVEVRDALASLPLELREPILLIDLFGESYADAARVLGVPEGTVKSRVHRGRGLLMAALSAREDADEG